MSEPAEDEVVDSILRKDEVAILLASKRCAVCRHLWVFHNSHCCSFCTVPGCECEGRSAGDEELAVGEPIEGPAE